MKLTSTLGKIWNFSIKFLGYFLMAALIIMLLFYFVWIPFKVARYKPATPTHLTHKAAYLEKIKAAAVNKDKPNVVIIMFDDLGYGDLSCYGNQLINTPNIDSVAKTGVLFTNFYSSSPVCTPSRAGLLTGRLPIRTLAGSVFFQTGSTFANIQKVTSDKANELARDEILFPEVMKAAGYQTGMIGKWHLGDIKGHLPNDFGFDDFYGTHYSNDMLPLHIYRNEAIEEEDKTVLESGALLHTDHEDKIKTHGLDHSTLIERYTNEATKFITKNKDNPFFLYFAHSAPHVPHYPSKSHKGKSAAGLYGDVIEDLDRNVKAVMEVLRDNGLEENTIVIITSDNGPDYNGTSGNLRGRKQDTFEGGQRVPLIVQWKNHLPANLVTNEMVMNIDFLPTVLSIIDLPLPTDRMMDGKNIFPVLQGEKSPHEYLFYTKAIDGHIAGIRNKHFKYHIGGFKAFPLFGALGIVKHAKPQLNDLLLDNESHNLIDKYPGISGELKREMDNKIKELDLENNKRGWLEE